MPAVTFFTENPWLGFADRDYRIIKETIIDKLQNPITGIPEITDHSQSNPFIKRVSIWAGIAGMIGYYVDNKGRESFLATARLFDSAVDLAKQYDYRIRGRIAATGEVTVKIDVNAPSDILIPIGTEFSNAEGTIFSSIAAGTILTGTDEITVPVRQWVFVPFSSIDITDGSLNQVFEINEKVADNTVLVKIATVPFTSIETFALAVSTDEVYRQQLTKNLVYSFQLGDDINGVLPTASSDVEAEWFETEGAAGNVGATQINILVSSITLPGGVNIESINNDDATVGGKEFEGLNDLKKNLPLSLRTLFRAVTDQDYIDITELAPGVNNAGIIFECGKFVDVFISPEGGGVASPTLIADTLTFLDDRRMVTTFVRVFAAGLVFVELKIRVRALPTFANNTVEASVIANLEEFYDNDNQDIGGTNFISDVYQVVENTEGVNNSDIDLLRPVPAAIPADPGSVALDWDRQQKVNSQPADYRIVFVTATDFNLFKNNVFIGSLEVGIEVNTDDIKFTINTAAYVGGDKYTFQTYLSSGNIDLDEPSLLAFDLSFVEITVTGGTT